MTVSALRQYVNDPVGFAVNALGYKPWGKQCEILEAMAVHTKVAVRSGHKIGKSACAAILALWWASTRDAARVVLLAPTGRQVRQILWREIKKLYGEALIDLGGNLFEMPDRGLQWDDGREIVGFSTDVSENLAGFSGPAMLFLCDESSGIEEVLYDVIRGNLIGGGSLAMFSNPSRSAGTFYEAFHGKQQYWKTIHVSSEETPNYIEGKIVIPGLATRDSIQELREEWGEESPLFAIRVKGDFPKQDANSVIGIFDVEASVSRWKEWRAGGEGIDPSSELVIGVDPARFGDDQTVICAVRGVHVLSLWVYSGLDTMAVADKVREAARLVQRVGEIPKVRVDEIGLGAGVVDNLIHDPYLSVVGVNVAEAATIEQYERKRDQVWFGLRDWLRAGGCIPEDNKLQGELVAPTYAYTARQKIKVESKDELKARLRRSPDRADALALAVFRDFLPSPKAPEEWLVGHKRTEGW